MKKQVSFLLAILFVFVAALIGTERTFSPTFQQCLTGQENSKELNAAKEKDVAGHPIIFGYARCTGDFLNGSEGLITALATIIIAAFTCTLWIATSMQAELTREALIADKRSFVFAKGLFSEWETGAHPNTYNWRFRPVWANTGDTPTKGLIIHTNCELRSTPLPANFDFDYLTTDIGSGLLGPHSESYGGVAPPLNRASIAPHDIVDIQAGTKFLYVWGWAKYNDVFPATPQHITRFCWGAVAVGNPDTFVPGTVAPAAGSLTFNNFHMTQGNCADEECSRS